MARTKRRVSVATPLRRCSKFNATRSPVNRARAERRDARGDLPRREFLAIVIHNFRFGRRVQKTKDLGEQFDSGEDQRRFGNHFAARALPGGTVVSVVMSPEPNILGQEGSQ